jgi:hypothetical protein
MQQHVGVVEMLFQKLPRDTSLIYAHKYLDKTFRYLLNLACRTAIGLFGRVH